MTDVIIIGAGPAGISAALYLKRIKKSVKIFTTNNSTLKKAHIIDNYYGTPNISGDELYNLGIKQALELGAEVVDTEVIDIVSNEFFEVITKDGKYSSKTVIIATGSSRLNSKIKNLDSYEGMGVSYCATCDGFFFRNKKLAVIGSGEFALYEAKHLLNVTSDVTILTNGVIPDDVIINSGISYDTKVITEVTKDEKFNINGGLYDGVFVALGVAGAANFAKKLGLEMDGNYLKVNNFETNIKGLYAIGDCIGGLLQISKAVNDGALVSIEINKYLRSLV